MSAPKSSYKSSQRSIRPSSPRARDEHAKALNEELEDERATELDKELAEGPAPEPARSSLRTLSRSLR